MSGWGAGANPPGGPLVADRPEPFSSPTRIRSGESDGQRMLRQLAELVDRYYRGTDPDMRTRLEVMSGLLRSVTACNAVLAREIGEYALEAFDARQLLEQAARVDELESDRDALETKLDAALEELARLRGAA